MSLSREQIIDDIRAKMADIESGVSHRKIIEFDASDAASFSMPPEARRRFGELPDAFRSEGRHSDRKARDHQAAMKKIERLCSLREQASFSLRDRLVRDGFPEEVARTAVDRAVACGLVDDARFADVLVRCRLAAGKGCAGIARELSSLGIDPDSVDAYREADAGGFDDEIRRALDVLARKPPHAKNAREAAFRKLMGKGFSSSGASSAARRWWESSRES